jgi:hypothetical protein
MLPPAMSPRPRTPILALLLLAALVLAAVAAGCGEEESEGAVEEVVEGEPVEVGELSYNIQITRFLNPDDNEDGEYLAGLPAAEPGTSYLGVFLVIENETEEIHPSAESYVVRDTLDEEYELVEGENPYSLDVGAEVPAEGQLPLPDTTADTGPNHGALLVFTVADEVSENRPLTLEIESVDGAGEVILDI